MKIKDVMSVPGVTVPPHSSVAESARLMAYEGVGSVLVVADGCPLGIVTDRDLVLRVLARDLPTTTAIAEVLSGELVTVNAADDIDVAFATFRRRPFRRLPVLADGEVAGMITVDDLLMLSHHMHSDLLGPVASELAEPQYPEYTPRTPATAGSAG
ncbi:MAG TPA: CBS domain-containing protein [Actinomycetes bacterium]|nr:CBS domain-containing protein [Actinomycetes bacterium]